MDPISIAMSLGDKLLGFIPNPAEKARAELEMKTALLNAMVEESKGQAETNKIEAGHQSIFVAGWRPAIGWVCAAGFGWTFLFHPLLSWFMYVSGVTTPLPEIDHGILLELTMGMLGMGALRSFDKWKGKSK